MISEEDIQAYKSFYESQGYVIVPSLIPASQLEPLRAAADRVTDKARAGNWTHVRTVGKQFPPWIPGEDVDVWGVQHVLHPDLGEGAFAEFYGGEDMLEVSRGLMGCKREDMQFELFNLLINPLRTSYGLSWHRDDVRASALPEEEREALAVPFHAVQWNAALYDDSCLRAVPASHRRVRTDEERKAGEEGGDMPGAVVVGLKAGETVFYNNNILHVGTYNPATKRRTLHGSYGAPPPGDMTRARNVLQHDLSYVRDPSFRDGLPENLVPMVDKLNGYYAALGGKEVGYSQDS
ncbi:hypothetical protein BCR39DRAFT_594234 [Naematelia encephala]|uniref:Phytanoyl-CoA dioxygenase n=1 Tax=Naematelia encephala TaxID=71784 RepID=A0A1Y2AZX9_9TREE|nr:hypothetical protein BCR39DRAFT_594234 [Naematelia encephala]